MFSRAGLQAETLNWKIRDRFGPICCRIRDEFRATAAWPLADLLRFQHRRHLSGRVSALTGFDTWVLSLAFLTIGTVKAYRDTCTYVTNDPSLAGFGGPLSSRHSPPWRGRI
jgi:hypothetical protein